MNRVIDLAETPVCPFAVSAFYDRFRERITRIRTAEHLASALGDMQEYFEEAVRQNPQIRNQMAAVYSYLKIRCREIQG